MWIRTPSELSPPLQRMLNCDIAALFSCACVHVTFAPLLSISSASSRTSILMALVLRLLRRIISAKTQHNVWPFRIQKPTLVDVSRSFFTIKSCLCRVCLITVTWNKTLCAPLAPTTADQNNIFPHMLSENWSQTCSDESGHKCLALCCV